MELRDYQQEAVKAVQKNYDSNIFRQLIVLPTGSGKTIIMAAIIQRCQKKTLILAHRKKLIEQAYEKIKKFWPDADVGMYKAQQNAINQQIVIGSIQTCSKPKHLDQLKKQNFSILVIDEAHHSESKSYQTIIKGLSFNDSPKLLIGLTATPHRADKKRLSNTFDKIVFSRSVGALIKNGDLPPVVGRKIITGYFLKGVKTTSDDFIAKQLAHAVNKDGRNTFIVEKYKEHAANRKAIAFCVNVQHCKDLATQFNKSGIKAAAIWGAMPRKECDKILADFKDGKIRVITSCELLTEGYDEETITAIIMARPTKSKTLYIQMVGRGLRKHPSKKDCLVLDFADTGNNIRNVISLDKAIPEAQYFQERKKIPTKKKPRYFNSPPKPTIDQEFDILGNQISLLWIQVDTLEWSLIDDNGNEMIIQKIDGDFIANLFYKNGTIEPLASKQSSREQCLEICENYARQNLNIKFADSNAPWIKRNEPATPGQMSFILNKGFPFYAKNKAEASVVIRQIIALENKQKRFKKEAQWLNIDTATRIH